jgi:putative membrane protein
MTETKITGPAAPARQADPSSRMSLVRTRLSYERTMLSWVRTATSLITFGFGVHQVFRVAPGAPTEGLHSSTPYYFGSAMVAIGLVTLVLAALENRGSSAVLDSAYPASEGYPPAPRSYGQILAGLIGFLGIAALILMNIRL